MEIKKSSEKNENSLLFALKMCSSTFTPNFINISLFFFNQGLINILFLIFLTAFLSFLSYILLIKICNKSNSYDYIKLTSEIFNFKFILIIVFFSKILKLLFAFSHFTNLILYFEYTEKFYSLFILFLLTIISYFSSFIFSNFSLIFSFVVGFLTVFITFIKSIKNLRKIVKPKIPLESTKNIYYDLAILFLWNCSHIDNLIKFKGKNESSIKKGVFLSSVLNSFIYSLVGFCGIIAYPNTKNAWLTNLDKYYYLVFFFLCINVLRLPGLINSSSKDLQMFFNLTLSKGKIHFFNIFFISFLIFFSSFFTAHFSSKILTIFVCSLIMLILPSLLGLKYLKSQKKYFFISVFLLFSGVFLVVKPIYDLIFENKYEKL